MIQLEQIKAGTIGLAIGDALGVPVEFKSRKYLEDHPVLDMQGYGTHHQPTGTWSDDTSLALCLLESLSVGYDTESIGKNFLRWLEQAHLTPHGDVFDIGISTSNALHRIKSGTRAIEAGGIDEKDNGNGSLMRTLPLAFFLKKKDYNSEDKKQMIFEVSSITHAHIRSKVSCWIYVEYAMNLLEGKSPLESYLSLCKEKDKFYVTMPERERSNFTHILGGEIMNLRKDEVHSSGYVIHSLEASFWCLLTSSSFEEAVLKAVNLGNDTDTTAAITGGIAGIYFGIHSIPSNWKEKIVKIDMIETLCERFYKGS